MFKSKLLVPLLRQRNAVRIIRYNYSSLRRPRQLGPRSRVLNHVEALRPKPTRIITEEMTPKAVTDEGSLLYDKAAPNNVQDTVVEVPIDDKHQIIKPDSRGATLLTQSAVIVCRQIEMMNVFLGYEQANRYKVMDPHGNLLAYILEEEGFGKSISRQFLRTHRKMNATVLSPEGDVMFKIVRPYSLVNSRIFIYTAEDELVGEVQQRWHLLRRKYDLFIGQKQFATIDTPFLGWDFHLQDENGGVLGNVNRNFVGFARELFTDTGEYVLRMDAAEGSVRGMTLDERAVTLACAVSIDFDYFSRHSTHGGGGFLPFPMFGYGGETREDPVVQDDQVGMNEPPSVSSPPPNTNEYGDPWLTDEQAGVSSPDDNSFMDVVSGFFKDNE